MPNPLILPPRVDFQPQEFEQIIFQKGREVLFEKSLPCPCKTASSNALPTCLNCGGSGWIFCDGKIVRMLVQGLSNGQKDEKGSQIVEGGVNLTFSYKDEVSFMDRITLMTESSIYQEVVIIKKNSSGEWFCHLSYPPTSIQFAGIFRGATLPIEKFESLPKSSASNFLKFNLPDSFNLPTAPKELSLTVRYRFFPSFHVTEISRESVQSFKYEVGSGETVSKLAGRAVGKKSHFIFKNFKPLLNNSLILDKEKCQ